MAKAKALARAWRMVRRLSPVERMALAEEAGFEGAGDLLESLAAKKGGVAPALMLQFLNSLRDRGDEGLSDVMAGLRDPEARDEILMRGADAVAEAFVPEGPVDSVVVDVIEPELQTPPLPIGQEEMAVAEAAGEPPMVLIQVPETEHGRPEPAPDVGQDTPESPPVVTETAQVEAKVGPSEGGSIDVAFLVEDLETEVSLVDRLLFLREAIPVLEAGGGDLGRLVKVFPEGWARRRALVALFEAGLPADVSDALDLINALERPADRRWCLGVLAARGDLRGAEADRALKMVESSTLRRRILRVGPLVNP